MLVKRKKKKEQKNVPKSMKETRVTGWWSHGCADSTERVLGVRESLKGG
jgi:hypothetical protein